MVTYKKCYCPRINDYISAEEANHLFIGKDTLGNIIQKKLFSNNEFQCAEDCQLNLTCINIGVDFSNPENSNKIKPYFSNRTGGTHCTLSTAFFLKHGLHIQLVTHHVFVVHS